MAIALAACSVTSERALSLAVHPSIVTLVPGQRVTIEASVNAGATLAVRGLPAGARGAFTNHTLSIETDKAMTPGVYTISILADEGDAHASANILLDVESASSFALTVDPKIVVLAQGTETTATVHLERSLSSPIDITWSSSKSGVTAAPISIANGTTSALVRISASPQASIGDATLTLHATSTGASFDVPVPVTIQTRSGTLDTSYGNGGLVIETTKIDGRAPIAINRAAMQPDGKLVVVGMAFLPDTQYDVLVLRYDQNGVLDPTFGTNGMVVTDLGRGDFDVANAVVLQPDGKIVTCGNRGYTEVAAVRYDDKGKLDPTFASGGIFIGAMGGFYQTTCNGLALQGDGKVVLAAMHSADTQMLRLDKNGSLDTSFGTAGIATAGLGQLTSVRVQQDGKLVFSGFDTNDWLVVRRNADGSPDFAKTIDFSAHVDKAQDLLLDPNGNILVSGTMKTETSTFVAVTKLAPDGSIDASFGTQGRTLVGELGNGGCGYACGNPIVLQKDGKILVAGGTTYYGTASMLLARMTPNGILDTSFGGTGRVYTSFGAEEQSTRELFVLPDQKILTLGFASSPVNDAVLARFWP